MALIRTAQEIRSQLLTAKAAVESGVTYGIDETSQFLVFVIAVAKSFLIKKPSGLVEIGAELAKLVPKAVVGIVGMDQIPKEFGDLDAAEKDAIKELVRGELDIEDDQLEDIINQAFGVSVELWVLAVMIQERSKN